MTPYSKGRFFWYLALLLVGAALVAAGFYGAVADFWSGMGTGLILLSLLRLVSFAVYRGSERYAKKVDTANSDERNRFLAEKARSWAMYYSLLLLGLGVLLFQLLGRGELALYCSYGALLLMAVYWVCWLILRKKY